jgi:hypothetical protein
MRSWSLIKAATSRLFSVSFIAGIRVGLKPGSRIHQQYTNAHFGRLAQPRMPMHFSRWFLSFMVKIFLFFYHQTYSSTATATSKPSIQLSEKKLRHLGWHLVLKFNLILSPPDCVDVLIVSIWPPNRSKMYLFCPMKPHILHSSSAFRSGTSAPFLEQNKYICGWFGVL